MHGCLVFSTFTAIARFPLPPTDAGFDLQRAAVWTATAKFTHRKDDTLDSKNLTWALFQMCHPTSRHSSSHPSMEPIEPFPGTLNSALARYRNQHGYRDPNQYGYRDPFIIAIVVTIIIVTVPVVITCSNMGTAALVRSSVLTPLTPRTTQPSPPHGPSASSIKTNSTGRRNGLPSTDSPLLTLPIGEVPAAGLPDRDSTPLNLLAAVPPFGLPTTDSPHLTLPIGVAPPPFQLPLPTPPSLVGVPPPSPLLAATLPLNSLQSAFQFSMLLTNSKSTVPIPPVVVPGVLGDDPAELLKLRVISSPAGDDRHSVSTARSSRRRWRRAESEARRSEVRVLMVDSRVTMWVAAVVRWVRREDWIF